MRLLRSPARRFALGSAAAILGVTFTLGAMPARAAQGGLPKVPAAGMHRLIVPPPGPGGVSSRGPRTAKMFVGTPTRVSKAEFFHSGGHSYPALPAPAATVQGGAEQAASSISNGAYTPLPPTRLLDTRTNGETLGPNSSLNLNVIGGSVPANADAVALNVTVTDTTAGSFLTVYPAGEPHPLVSNLNWAPGETVPNLVIVPVGSGGEVTFYNDQGRTDVVVDLEGYFAPEPSNTTVGSYVPLTPSRIVDTRAGSGEPYSGDTMGPGGSLDIQVTGRGGVPTGGVSAVLMNVTVTDTTAPSYLTAYPQGESQPLASNLNWLGGETVANRVVVPVNPTTGQITVYNDQGNTDVVVDVDGYFTNGGTPPANAGLFSTITPVRVLDTRTTAQTLGPGDSLTQPMAGVDGIGTQATAVVTNVTVTDTTAPSYLTVYPGPTRPLASDVNWLAGQTVPNLTVATLSSSGATSVYNDQGNTDVVIDAFGYFGPRVPLSITTTSLTPGTVGNPYSAALQATGGNPPYSWALIAGSFPAGLTISASGTIQGTPTVTGTSAFTVQVADSTTPTAETASAQLSLTVAPAPLAITTAILPNGVAGAPYSATLAATGGTPPYSWALTSGALPSGLILSSSGAISGTPTASGTFDLGIQVSDSTSPTHLTAGSSLTLNVSPSLAVATTSLPNGTVGASYSATLQAAGGTPPYSWTLTSGSLPSGLTLSISGVIAGTPTSAQTYTFTVQVTDSTTPTPETATQSLTLTVDPGPPTQSTAPNWSGYAVGGNQTGALAATSVTGTFTVPELTYAASCNDAMAVWNGIDGYNNEYLIQAGVALQTVAPYGSTAGSCTPGYYYIVPWWEVITPTNAAPETYIETWDNGSQAVVNVGDQVTVTVYQVSSGEWNIILVDNTTGGTFDYYQYYGSYLSYAGPGASAEWIVEDTDQPSNPNCTWPGSGFYLCPMPTYGPPVSFTGTSFNFSGVYGATDQIYMVDQIGNVVSQPSSLGTNGDFTVSYVGSGTNAPYGAVRVKTLGSKMPSMARPSPKVRTSTGFNLAYGDLAPSPP